MQQRLRYEVGTLVHQRYSIKREVHHGRKHLVFEADDLETGGAVALKIDRAGTEFSSRRITEEAELLVRLTHPGIARVANFGELEDGRRFLATDWIDGKPVTELIAQKLLTAHTALVLVGRIAYTLSAIHEQEIVHRDLKPANIVVPTLSDKPLYDDARLIDFGVARMLRKRTARDELRSGWGVLSGTLLYMAPEQLLARRETVATDVFGLGAVLFEALVGTPPHVGDEADEQRMVLTGSDPPIVFAGPFVTRRLSQPCYLPPDIQIAQTIVALLERMLRFADSERPSMLEVADELARITRA